MKKTELIEEMIKRYTAAIKYAEKESTTLEKLRSYLYKRKLLFGLCSLAEDLNGPTAWIDKYVYFDNSYNSWICLPPVRHINSGNDGDDKDDKSYYKRNLIDSLTVRLIILQTEKRFTSKK